MLDLPIYRAVKLIEVAHTERKRDKLYQLYLTDRPYLQDNLTFNDYYAQAYPEPVHYDTRDKDEIMREILTIGGDDL